MAFFRRYARIGSLTPLVILMAAVPGSAMAAGFFGPILPQSGSCHCPSDTGGTLPLDWGCVLQVLQNLIQFAVSIGVILCVLWIAYAGFSLMVSGGSAQARSQGKTRIMNAVVGIVVILAAWLVVDFVMKTLYQPDTLFNGGRFGPWNSILAGTGDDYCIYPHTPVAITTGSILSGITAAPPGTYTGGTGTGSGGGSCAILNLGACSVASLQTTCFSNRVDDAARICNMESAGGSPTILSGSDKLNGGSGPSYSVGLWQINLTSSPLSVNGQSCKSAFTGTCGSGNGSLIGSSHPGWCTQSIKSGMQDLYNKCVAAAQNPQTNTQVACTLYKGSTFSPWAYSANRCAVTQRL